MIDVVVVTGSIRDNRIGSAVSAWLTDCLKNPPELCEEEHELTVRGLDLAEVDLPWTLPAETAAADVVTTVGETLADAEAYVLITPEYNHGYPAALKNLLDLYASPWAAKPVALVSYGGQAAGLRAVEQLRPVLSELHAVPLRDTVSISNPWEYLDDEGQFRPGERTLGSLRVMRERLVWWSEVLTIGRAARPYRR